MKTPTNQKYFTFIMAIMLCLFLPTTGNAQKENEKKPPTYCNCFVRPIPPKCGQICGWRLAQPPDNTPLLNTDIPSTTVGFELKEDQDVSDGTYDVSERLVRSIVEGRMAVGYLKIDWRSNQTFRYQLPAGVYFLKQLQMVR